MAILVAEPQNGGMTITVGTVLEATTASGAVVRMRALGEPLQGRDFPVVWVCTEGEYEADGPEAEGIPWPLDAIVVLEPA